MTEISNTNSSADIINQHVFTYNTQDLRGGETISGSVLPAIPSLPNETREYAYNTVNQLLSVTNPNLTFVYDDDGNMTQGYDNEAYRMTNVLCHEICERDKLLFPNGEKENQESTLLAQRSRALKGTRIKRRLRVETAP